ncbi:hypothetical protein PKCBPO_03870 [Methylorubrum thiocyanatum]
MKSVFVVSRYYTTPDWARLCSKMPSARADGGRCPNFCNEQPEERTWTSAIAEPSGGLRREPPRRRSGSRRLRSFGLRSRKNGRRSRSEQHDCEPHGWRERRSKTAECAWADGADDRGLPSPAPPVLLGAHAEAGQKARPVQQTVKFAEPSRLTHPREALSPRRGPAIIGRLFRQTSCDLSGIGALMPTRQRTPHAPPSPRNPPDLVAPDHRCRGACNTGGPARCSRA